MHDSQITESIHKPGRADLPVGQAARQFALAGTVDSGPVDLSTDPQLAAPKPGEGGSAFPSLSKSPYSTGVFAFSREIQLSEHSALMGGQFPTEKNRDAFKNPIFYAVAAVQTAPKKELSEFDGPNTSFYRSLKLCQAGQDGNDSCLGRE